MLFVCCGLDRLGSGSCGWRSCFGFPALSCFHNLLTCFLGTYLCVPAEEEALAALAAFPGVSIINDRAANRFPTPLDASNKDDVYVGRVRRDISRPDSKGLDIFVCGDQIKKGAALNAVQVAELLL